MGTSLEALEFPTGLQPVSLYSGAGANFTCALFDDDSLRCWGANEMGQLGREDTEAIGDEDGELATSLESVSLGTGLSVVGVSVGFDHACALLDDATVKCWGGNSNGQLGQGDTNPRGATEMTMGDLLGTVSLGSAEVPNSVTAGYLTSCATFVSGRAKCWGLDGYVTPCFGKMCTTDPDPGDEPGEMGDELAAVHLGGGRAALTISTGVGHWCARLYGGSVKCWGTNPYGQLGIGTTVEVTLTNVAGTADTNIF
jgi:alpha-tubulin suppressor-like RCC1 family protein